jgi:hypothetical protein
MPRDDIVSRTAAENERTFAPIRKRGSGRKTRGDRRAGREQSRRAKRKAAEAQRRALEQLAAEDAT